MEAIMSEDRVTWDDVDSEELEWIDELTTSYYHDYGVEYVDFEKDYMATAAIQAAAINNNT
jgi:hypothetical protein